MLQLNCFCVFMSLFLLCCSLLVVLKIIREKSFILKIFYYISLPSQQPFSAIGVAAKVQQGSICLDPMEWCIQVTAKNGADLMLTEKSMVCGQLSAVSHLQNSRWVVFRSKVHVSFHTNQPAQNGKYLGAARHWTGCRLCKSHTLPASLLWDVIRESAICRWFLQLQPLVKFCCLSDEVLLCFLWKTLCSYVTKLIAPQFDRILWVYFKFKMFLQIILSLLLMLARVYFWIAQCYLFTYIVFCANHSFIAIKFTIKLIV